VARKKELTLIAGKTRRLQQPSRRSWSQAKAKAFLNVLAETCNATEASRQSGVPLSTVARRKRTDAKFRASWFEAIATPYQRLELVMLERAFNGTEKLVTRRDGRQEVMREYSNQLGLSLLKMYRDTAVEANLELPPSEIEEIRQRLIQKVRRLKQRRDAERGAPDAA
jgi:hypothetical protein